MQTKTHELVCWHLQNLNVKKELIFWKRESTRWISISDLQIDPFEKIQKDLNYDLPWTGYKLCQSSIALKVNVGFRIHWCHLLRELIMGAFPIFLEKSFGIMLIQLKPFCILPDGWTALKDGNFYTNCLKSKHIELEIERICKLILLVV